MTPRGMPSSLYELAPGRLTPAAPPPGQRPPEPTLGDVLADLWHARRAVFKGAAAGVVLAFVLILLSVPAYRAQILLSPASTMNGAEQSSLMANDNLYALRYVLQRVGVGSSDFTRFESTYAGPSVARLLLADPKIAAGLRHDRAFRWDRGRRFADPARLADYLSHRVRLESVGTGGLKRLTYWHADPAFAAYFVGRVHAATDLIIRNAIRNDASQRVDYLSRAIDGTMNPENRKALTTLLMEQERLRMLASIDQPYAAAVIEPPAAAFRSGWPDRALWLVFGALIGALAGYVLHAFRHGR